MKHHPREHNHQNGDHHHDDDDGTVFGISLEDLGLDRPLTGFIHLVDAIIAHPASRHQTAGHDGATDAASKLFWTYDTHEGLTVRAAPGLLTTATGNGGFALHVDTNGSWALKFDGSNRVIGHEAGTPQTPPPPPAPDLKEIDVNGKLPGGGGEAKASGVNDQPELLKGNVAGWDTFQGGVGDYMAGGGGTAGGGLAGKGNCAVYNQSPGSILVDMQNGSGHGGNAEGNVYDNMNQVRGSLKTNVLIGNTGGTDLKSGGDNSVLISTGGMGFEMRPDGRGDVLVSTVGGDRLRFEAGHGWALGDDNIMLGFNLAHGCTIDLTGLTNGDTLDILNSADHVVSTFQAGISDITDYVSFTDVARDGTHVMFDPTGQVKQGGGYDLIDLKFTHGLDVQAMYAADQLLA